MLALCNHRAGHVLAPCLLCVCGVEGRAVRVGKRERWARRGPADRKHMIAGYPPAVDHIEDEPRCLHLLLTTGIA